MMMIYVYHTYLINIDEDDYYDDGYGEELCEGVGADSRKTLRRLFA